jgi:hypothetical protein
VEEFSRMTVTTDDFESGADKWVLSGFSSSTTQAHSGSWSMFSGMTNNQVHTMTSRYQCPVLPGDSLTFWLWLELEYNHDVLVTEVSENGLEWHILHDRYDGSSGGWRREAFSLEPWAGRSVYIRMRVMTDDTTLLAGVYVDDVHPVPMFDSIAVLDTAVTDTTYEVTGRAPGTYWYRVRGHNATWGWNNHGPLEDVVVAGTGASARAEASHVGRVPPSVVRGVLRLDQSSVGDSPLRELLDISGRRVVQLRPGANDIRHVTPGVYFVRGQASTIRRVIIAD